VSRLRFEPIRMPRLSIAVSVSGFAAKSPALKSLDGVPRAIQENAPAQFNQTFLCWAVMHPQHIVTVLNPLDLCHDGMNCGVVCPAPPSSRSHKSFDACHTQRVAPSVSTKNVRQCHGAARVKEKGRPSPYP